MQEINNKTRLVPKLRFKEFGEEWRKRKLDEVVKIGRGKSKHRPRNASFLYGGKYPFVQTGDIKAADLYLTKYTQTYSEEGLKQSKLWDENTLCITIAANIAETAILKIKACFPDSIIGLIPKENQTIVLFVKYLFDKFKLEIQNLSQGVAQDNLNQEKLSNIEFNIPSLPEQQKIAAFLSAVDEKIQQLTRTKELLEQYKKGVMQKLFSGELRFKDEKGMDFLEWEEKRLGDVATFFKGKGISKLDIDAGGQTECIRYGQLYTEYKETIYKVISKTNVSTKELVLSEANDVIIPSSGETQIDIATASCVLKSGIALGGDLNIIRSKMNGVFLSYYLNTKKKFDIARLSQGITVVHLYPSQLGLLKLAFPCLEEQQKIAEFLSGIDTKIERITDQITHTQAFKKGLLQQMFV